MKTFRSLAALFVLALGHLAAAQESSEVASLRAKAEKGNGIAQYNLGLAYADGKGVARDPIEAYVWLSLARENGARGRALDNVVATLDKASLDLARQRITERKTALGMTPGAPAAATKPATPAPAIVKESKSAAPSLTGATGADTAEDPAIARLRKERDAYSTKIGEIAADLFTVRTDRDRLAEQAAEILRNTQAVSAASLSLQEQVRAAEARAAELARTNAAMQAELARTKQELATLTALSSEATRAKQEAMALLKAKEDAPRPAPDTAALDAKTRELQAALAELEAARQFGRQVEDTLNKVNDDRARVAANAAAELEAARQFGQQVEVTLNKVNDQKAALETQLATVQRALAAKSAAPGYPDLSGRVSELETALASARHAAPAYPDLSGRVRELEAQLTAGLSAGASAKAEAGRAQLEVAALTNAKEGIQRELATAKAALAQANQALATKPAAPNYPDLSGRVRELEAQVSADLSAVALAKAEAARAKQEVVALTQAKEDARSAAPAYPNLTDRVRELEAQRSSDLSAVASAKAEATRAKQEIAALTLAKEAAQSAKPAAPAYPDLSSRVNELEAALATSIQKFGAAEQARTETARQFDDYKSATAAAQRERITLQATLKMLESDKTSLRRQVDAATTESNQLRTQVAALKTQAAALRPATPGYPDLSGRVGELESQLAKANTDLSALGSAKADLSGKVAELESALAARPAAPSYPDLSGRVTELETALAAKPVAPAYPDLRTNVSALETQLATAQQALAAKPVAPTYPDLSGRVSELEAALAALGSEANRAKLEIAALNEAKEAARNSSPAYPDLTNRVGELESQLARAQIELSATSSAKTDLTGRVNELAAEITQLRTDRERMQKLLADSGRQLAEATAAARSRPVAPAGYSERVRELEAALAQAKASPAAPAYPDLSGRVGELESQLAKANTDLSAAGSAKADLTGEVAQLRTDRERMQKMLADVGRQLRDNTADTARIKELETQLAGLSAAASQTKQEILALTKAKEDAQAQTGGLTSERDALSSEAARAKQEIATLTQAKEDARNGQQELRDTIARLEREKAQLASAKPIQAGTPAYPDLSGRVRELEAQVSADLSAVALAKAEASRAKQEVAALTKAKEDAPRGQAAPAYPDLSGRVSELESALAAAKQQLAQTQSATASTGDTSGLEQKLADSEDRLATALRGYAALQRERDTLAENASQSAAAIAAERDVLAGQVASLTGQVEQLRASAQSSEGSTQAELTRLGAAVTALQRTTAQASGDLAAARALAQQLQGANSVLAGENYQLKTMLARTTGGPAPATAPVTAPAARTHVVVAGDSLSRLSQRYYGSAGRWQEIYNANAPLLGPNGVLRVGTELRIP